MIVLIDNYDSFTYNIFQLLSSLGAQVEVRRNDEVSVDEVRRLRPTGVVVSPGPGAPAGAGISCRILQDLGPELPMLGVCLGHQCITSAFGGAVGPARELMHGKISKVFHAGAGVFSGLPSPFDVVRYHSLAVDRATLPACLEITAETEDGTIMGLRHREYPIEGVQFHPESILTREGPRLMENFLNRL